MIDPYTTHGVIKLGEKMGLAVITGGGRGIMRCNLKKTLLKDGHQILLTYNTDSQSAESVIAELRKDNVDCVLRKSRLWKYR